MHAVGEAAAPVARHEAGDVGALGAQLLGDEALHDADRRRAADGGNQRRHAGRSASPTPIRPS